MSDWIIILKLLLATLLGGVLGYERGREKKAAGLRTHILVCVGSALFMLISMHVAENSQGGADPGRIASQVVTGIGFLCAGTIFQSQGSISGLTTAASIWIVSAIGLAVGSGFIWPAVATAMITFFVLQALRSLAKYMDITD